MSLIKSEYNVVVTKLNCTCRICGSAMEKYNGYKYGIYIDMWICPRCKSDLKDVKFYWPNGSYWGIGDVTIK